jgi:hypothetical protein
MELFYKRFVARSGSLLMLFVFTSTVQAAFIGDLFISEVMINPNKVLDPQGEWFELFNPTNESVDLNQAFILDDGGNSHQISHAGPLLISPNQYFVLARNGDSLTNGGFVADYVYSSFTLVNSGDEIIFTDGVNELLRLNYSSKFDAAGRSRELMSIPMIENNYQLTSSMFTYGLGDIGTPGEPGSVQYPTTTMPVPSTALLFVLGFYVFRRHKF